jgi:hypothetical protein
VLLAEGKEAAGREDDQNCLPSPQAPSEAEPAADLIDMGPDPAATSNLSSRLAGMSKYGWGYSEGYITVLTQPHNRRAAFPLHSSSRTLSQTPPLWSPKPNLAARLGTQGKTCGLHGS